MEAVRHPRLLKRAGWFYLRAKVPADLVAVLGKREIKKALGTSDARKALVLVRQESAKVDRLFEDARRTAAAQRMAKPAATDAEIVAIVRRWWRDHHRPGEADLTVTGADVEDVLHALHLDEAALLDRDDPNVAASIHGAVTEIMRRHRLDLDPSSREHALVRELVRRGFLEGVRQRRAHAAGDFSGRVHDHLFAASADEPAPDKRDITLGHLITAYEKDPARSGLSAKTVGSYAPVFRALKELLGAEKPVRQITRDDCRRVRDVLVSLPPNATKLYPGMPLARVVDRAKADGLPPLHATTVNNHLNNLSALFGWAVQEEHVDRNPATGLRVANPVAKRDRRRPFTAAELQTIFAGSLYRTALTGDAWVMLVSLFAGLRLNEACQLGTADIEIVDDVPVIRVRLDDAGTARIKTTAGRRTVPIHSALVAIGLLDHWRKTKDQGERQLFADLKPAATGYYSDAVSKRLNRYIRSLGITDRKAVVHSLRHNWRDALREANVPAERVRALGGWTSKSAGEDEHTYGAGFTVKALAAEIEKIVYPGLDLFI